jgi:HEPN domain-containing protein
VLVDDWLYRLKPEEWLRAAENELRRAGEALAHRQQRAGVAGCRRAAGMAWNAVLAQSETPDPDYGRSYMEHLQALARDVAIPEAVRAAAQTLVDAPLTQELLTLGKPDPAPAQAARAIVAHARERISPGAQA